MQEDARRAAARYRVERDSGERPEDADPVSATLPSTPEGRSAVIETSIQQAIRAGEFDDLPGAGKPLTGLGGRMDPDWWIRRKIQNENLSGLGPPALALRGEDAALTERLDGLHRESEVRSALEDFNRRVVEARRQLQGGPPVVTPLRDIEVELVAWRERRSARVRPDQPEEPRPTWRERRRARREARRSS